MAGAAVPAPGAGARVSVSGGAAGHLLPKTLRIASLQVKLISKSKPPIPKVSLYLVVWGPVIWEGWARPLAPHRNHKGHLIIFDSEKESRGIKLTLPVARRSWQATGERGGGEKGHISSQNRGSKFLHCFHVSSFRDP